MLETLSELVREQPLISLGVGVAIGVGLNDTFKWYSARPEFKPMKVGDYSFKGKCIAKGRGFQMPRPRSEFHCNGVSLNFQVCQTEKGNYVTYGKFKGSSQFIEDFCKRISKIAKNESELFDIIEKFPFQLLDLTFSKVKTRVSKQLYKEGLNFSKVKTRVSKQLYKNGLESFKELISEHSYVA